MVEDVVDGDEHLAGDCDEGSVVSSTFHDSHVELAESEVVSCGLVGGFDEYPADVAVSFFRDWSVCCVVAGLTCAGCEACLADKLLWRVEAGDGSDLVDQRTAQRGQRKSLSCCSFRRATPD
jgi:hypothetical protein